MYRSNHVDLDVIVVDNNSQNNLKHSCEEIYKGLRYVRLDDNMGAAYANNLGISEARHDFICILNADVFLSPDYLNTCIDFLLSNQNVAEVQGLLLSDKDPNVIDSAGVVFFKEGMAIDRYHGASLNSFIIDDQPTKIDGTCCAAAIYRKSDLNDCKTAHGFYNEVLFAFYEDFELSARLRGAGKDAYFVPKALATHVRGGSTAKNSKFVRFLHLRNIILINKYLITKTMFSNLLGRLYVSALLLKNLDVIPLLIDYFAQNKDTLMKLSNLPKYPYHADGIFLLRKMTGKRK